MLLSFYEKMSQKGTNLPPFVMLSQLSGLFRYRKGCRQFWANPFRLFELPGG